MSLNYIKMRLRRKQELSLKVENVKKAYSGKIAVDNISFKMDEPGVFGLLGTNGARENNHNKNDVRNY